MSIQIPKSFTNSNLPTVSPIGSTIKNDAQLVAWYQFDPAQAEVDISGNIINLSPRHGSSSQKLNTLNEAWRPQLAANKIGGYSAGVFDLNSAMVALGNSVVDLSQNFSIAMIFRPRVSEGTEHAYMTWFNDPSNHILIQNYNGIGEVAVHVAGPEGGVLQNILPVDGKLHLLVASFTPSATKASGDGIRKTDLPVTSGSVATRGNGQFALNSLTGECVNTWPTEFDLGDVLLFQKDLFSAGNEATLNAIYKYAKYVYGIDVQL